jgi:TonB family protein
MKPVSQPATTLQKTAKTSPVPRPPAPVASATDSKAREREIAQEIQASQQKASHGARDEAIQDSVRGLEKGLNSKARNQAYQEAVGQAAARVSAGKVSARLAGKGGKTGSAAGAGNGDKGKVLSPVYGQTVARLIRGHWSPQCNPRNNHKTLKTIVVVRVAANGNIVASWFEQESGDRLYDQAAMAAVTRANPLPALPPGQTQLEIGVTFIPEWKADS